MQSKKLETARQFIIECAMATDTAHSAHIDSAHYDDGTYFEYARFLSTQPPIAKEAKEDSIYAECDEKAAFKMGEFAFDIETVPKPSEDLELQLNQQHNALIRSHKRLQEAIKDYKDFDPYMLTQKRGGMRHAIYYRIAQNLNLPSFTRLKTTKDVRQGLFAAINDYLRQRTDYLDNYCIASKADPEKHKSALENSLKTQLIAMSHLALANVKSACHSGDNARRKNGSLVIMHCYRITMQIFNEHQPNIDAAETEEELINAYQTLGEEVLGGILHDFSEDFGALFDEDFLRSKLREYLNQRYSHQAVHARPHVRQYTDNDQEAPRWDKQKEGQPPILLELCIDEGLELAKALDKGPKAERKIMEEQWKERVKKGEAVARLEPHIDIKILELDSPIRALRAFKQKLKDRIDNINTLMELPQRARKKKLDESKELLERIPQIQSTKRFQEHQGLVAQIVFIGAQLKRHNDQVQEQHDMLCEKEAADKERLEQRSRVERLRDETRRNTKKALTRGCRTIIQNILGPRTKKAA